MAHMKVRGNPEIVKLLMKVKGNLEIVKKDFRNFMSELKFGKKCKWGEESHILPQMQHCQTTGNGPNHLVFEVNFFFLI